MDKPEMPELLKEVPTMATVDGLFDGELVLAVPAEAEEYNRKMPGAYDAQGDYCSG